MQLKNIDFGYHSLPIFDQFSLHFSKNEVTVILGPSGCGKTTLLNLLSGALFPDSGLIKAPKPGDFSYMFQQPVLLPWKTCAENIEFILPENWTREKKKETVIHYLELTGLEDFKEYYPEKLSGGMKQRLALARCFAFPTETIYMDEPFIALDLKLKMNLLDSFKNLWNSDQRTSILVTHDIQEALILGDRILVFSPAPVSILMDQKNPLPSGLRTPGHPELLSLENKIYTELLR